MAGRFVFQSSRHSPVQIEKPHHCCCSRQHPSHRRCTRSWRGTQVARHFNTFPCSRPAAKTSCTATGMPSIINRRLKLFSTKAGRVTLEEMAAKDDKLWGQIMCLCGFSCISCTFGLFLEECTSSYKNRSSSHLCSSCSNCQHSI